MFIVRATEQRVATLTQIAAFSHRDPSTLCKQLAQYQQKLRRHKSGTLLPLTTQD
jgi:hypothetical protein